ncbi:MAG: hypothetical protein OHK006_10640 [Thermodesulfovibrionales bacterium]
MTGTLYKKPILFSVVAFVVILVGTLVTMFIPMMTEQMHPKLENLKPFTPLQLAGRDIYQREGCNNCHTQTVRPLKTEVMRYGEYSKAGEFAYDRPFLWGSKRTGPDLARIGGKYPDTWHYQHFENPKAFFAQSNMPVYGWMKNNPLDSRELESHMKAMHLPYTPEDLKAVEGKNELDALVAYMQVIGIAVAKKPAAPAAASGAAEEQNPFAGNHQAAERGEDAYKKNCESCHGDDGKGGIGPSLRDKEWLGKPGDISDGALFAIIANGTENGMPPYSGSMDKNGIWSIVTYIRELQAKKGDHHD